MVDQVIGTVFAVMSEVSTPVDMCRFMWMCPAPQDNQDWNVIDDVVVSIYTFFGRIEEVYLQIGC